MDILVGYWATLWQPTDSVHMSKGATSATLEALTGLLATRNLQYVSESNEVAKICESALDGGRSTWPVYAINARGGVVVEEDDATFEYPGLMSNLPAVKLLKDYHWQTESYAKTTLIEWQLADLMMLDTWLSICGREPEILDGDSDLIHNMPLLIQFLFEVFENRFEEFDRSANQGGLQQTQKVARSLVETLDNERLSAAEKVFTLVAMLRTTKVGSCIANGPSTRQLLDILDTDQRVWLV